jgi:hypothetical protein
MSEQQEKPVEEMPNFSLNDLSFETDEAADEAGKKGQALYFDKPGQYDLVIEEATYAGKAENDENWGKVQVTLHGPGERRIKDTILVPFADIKYGEKQTMFPWNKLKNFASALGTDLSVKTLKAQMTSLFRAPSPAKLVGKAVRADIGYQKAYVKYAGKDAAGANQFHIVGVDKNVVAANGQPVVFGDRDAALAYAATNKIAIDKYSNVLKYYKAAGTQATADGSW